MPINSCLRDSKEDKKLKTYQDFYMKTFLFQKPLLTNNSIAIIVFSNYKHNFLLDLHVLTVQQCYESNLAAGPAESWDKGLNSPTSDFGRIRSILCTTFQV